MANVCTALPGGHTCPPPGRLARVAVCGPGSLTLLSRALLLTLGTQRCREGAWERQLHPPGSALTLWGDYPGTTSYPSSARGLGLSEGPRCWFFGPGLKDSSRRVCQNSQHAGSTPPGTVHSARAKFVGWPCPPQEQDRGGASTAHQEPLTPLLGRPSRPCTPPLCLTSQLKSTRSGTDQRHTQTQTHAQSHTQAGTHPHTPVLPKTTPFPDLRISSGITLPAPSPPNSVRPGLTLNSVSQEGRSAGTPQDFPFQESKTEHESRQGNTATCWPRWALQAGLRVDPSLCCR